MSNSIWDLPILEAHHAGWLMRVRTMRERLVAYRGGNDARVTFYMKHHYMLATACSQVNACIKGIYAPLASVVAQDVGLVPGGWLLDERSERHQETWEAVAAASGWKKAGDLYVQYAAVFGNGCIYVNPETLGLVVLRPDQVYLVRDGGGEAVLGVICRSKMGQEGAMVEWAHVFDRNAWGEYVDGERVDGGEHGYGVVPIVDQPFIDVGEAIGECTFEHALEPLREVNRTATQLSENIKRNSDPQWVAITDDDAPDDPEKAVLERSSDKLWVFSGGSRVDAVVAALDIPGVMQAIDTQRTQLERHLPELAVLELRGVERIALETIQTQMADLHIKIGRIRRGLDCGLVDALRMLGRMARVDEGDVRLAALDDLFLGFDEERPVLPMGVKARLECELLEIQVETARAVADGERMLGVGA